MISAAVEKVFGQPHYAASSPGDSGECIYPLKVLRFATADVLLTIGNVPGESCHGCAACLSAYVLRREAGGSRLVSRIIDFAETGTWGDPGTITPIQIGSDDAIAIESGGTFQGYSMSVLNLYAFRGGRAVNMTSDGVFLSTSNAGAMTDPRKVVNADGSWALDPKTRTKLSVDYKIHRGGKISRTQVVWALRGNKSVIVKGSEPPEIAQLQGVVTC
jgi:hypothetical protein